MLGDDALHRHRHVAELGIGQQLAVEEDGAADAGAKGEYDHDTLFAALAGAKGHFGDTGGVGVVKQHDLALCHLRKQPLGIKADPALVDIGGRHGDAVADDSRKRAANGTLPGKVAHDLVHYFGDCLRRRGLRGFNAVAFADHVALVQIHNCTLDTAAADIDSQALHSASSTFISG